MKLVRKTDLRYGLLLICVFALLVNRELAAQSMSFEGPPIDYMKAEVHDPVAQLAAKIESGEVQLDYDSKQGYLKSVLDALGVPVSSQTLVFSKTSLQLHRISPRRPRAIYFNDDTYVGFCQQGDVLEFATTDPSLGAIFYTLKQDPDVKPTFVRDQGQCLSCHANNRTQNVPGYLVRSVFTDGAGHPSLANGTFLSDHTSPFDERWGGWYVTGQHGDMRHMGNVIFKESEVELDRETGANLNSLDGVVSTTAYLTPHSDIVALMVLEHQTQMHNAIAAANYETRQALHQSFQMNKLLEREPDFISDSANRRIDSVAKNLVSYLLMREEFKLQSPVKGTSNFASEFASLGPRDDQGRSLRDFDLTTRLFKYPCSYLIYSPAFDALPDEVRGRVTQRLLEILESRDDLEEYSYLTQEMRRDIFEILKATKPDLFDVSSEVSAAVDAKE